MHLRPPQTSMSNVTTYFSTLLQNTHLYLEPVPCVGKSQSFTKYAVGRPLLLCIVNGARLERADSLSSRQAILPLPVKSPKSSESNRRVDFDTAYGAFMALLQNADLADECLMTQNFKATICALRDWYYLQQ